MIKNVKLKVVGVTFTNEDGTSRQSIIREIIADDTITLRREPTNKFDTNAVAVFVDGEGQVGYIGKDYSSILAPMMDAGTQFEVTDFEAGEYKGNYFLHILIDEVGAKDSTQLSGGHLW
jgi:hypothetical protein